MVTACCRSSKLRLAAPSVLVDVRGLSGLDEIETDDELRIEALATHRQILRPDHRRLPAAA